MIAHVKIKKDDTDHLIKALNQNYDKVVLVGIPKDKTTREDEPITNAAIGYIQEYGSPANNIPPRPFLGPGIKKSREKIIPFFEKAAMAVLSGDEKAIQANFEKAGLIASACVKNYLATADFKPLSLATIRNRAYRNGGRGVAGAKEELARLRAGGKPNNNLVRPLIDTGQLANSITYVVRDRKDTGKDGKT